MKNEPFTNNKAFAVLLSIIRFAIGWHFLYEGFSKLLSDNWSSASYLMGSNSFLANFYHWLASSETLVTVIDFINIYGLIAIGLGLSLGLFIRWASIGGITLLCLYYFAYPPFGASVMMQSEGALFIVNKLFIEASILAVFIFLNNTGYGIDNLMFYFKKKKGKKEEKNEPSRANNRREVIKNLASVPLLGVFGFGALDNRSKYQTDSMSGATIKVGAVDLKELKGELPKGKIGKHEMSRLVLGGNLIGGWAHSRDLLYVSSLFKAYNNEKKVFETLNMAEQTGIDSINIGFSSNPLMAKYKKLTGSKIKVISQVGPNMKNNSYLDNIKRAIDYGADIIQIQGNWCDWLVRDNRLDVVHAMMDYTREQGYTAGLASHSIESLLICEEEGIIPDYYMKTMHHDNYWSAHPRENRVPFEVDGKKSLDHNKWHDNCFCLFPDKTIEFINRVKVPVMGFKVLAAGAIKPEDGFNWAFQNGADFICVGMFDFQLVNNVNITIDILNKINSQNRIRPWYA